MHRIILKHTLLCFSLAFILVCHVNLYADLQDGLKAYEASNYAKALTEFRPLANQGVVEAQYRLGLMYNLGLGVPQSYIEALKWYRLAGEKGHVWAQVYAGGILYNQEGVVPNFSEALKWFKLASAQGNAIAYDWLAEMYFYGQGVQQDYAKALQYYNVAAEKESKNSQTLSKWKLGWIYENGKGVPQNYILAHMWYNLAAAAGFEVGISNRDRIASFMTPEQIAEAQKLAIVWQERYGSSSSK